MFYYISTLILIFTLTSTLLAVPLTPSETFTHKLIVDDDKSDAVQLFWKVVNDEIIFEVHAKTTGWIGVGISPNGGMAGSDIAIGWIDDKTNKAYLRDTHAKSKDKPIVDKHQDWFLLDGSLQIDDYTIIKMKRKLQTCDEQDQDIIDGSTWMIFAWHKDDPKFDGDWSYHGDNRRTKTALLMDFKENSIDQQDDDLPKDTVTYDIIPDLVVPTKDTIYWCDVFKLPVYEQDLHLIKFEMMINKKNKDIVHHYDVYECADDYVHTEKVSQECGDVKLPGYINEKCNRRLFLAWSIGGQYNYSFPQETGFPLVRANKVKYVMTQVHYDNYRLFKGRWDNSSVRLYMTPTLRKYDLGMLTLGNMGSNGLLSFTVPPKADSITFSSICYPDCTNKFPEDGIYALAGIMHTHLLGRSVRTTLVRDNKIIKNLLYNPNYDFNYQYIFDMKPVKIQRGDMLITECTYSSTNYNNFTFIGYSTREEMCFSFMYYYPSIRLESCGSAVSVPEIQKFYSSLMKDSLIPQIKFNDTHFDEQQKEISILLETKIQGTKTLAKRYTDFFESRYIDHPKCTFLDHDDEILENRVRFVPEKDLTVKKCTRSFALGMKSSNVIFYVLLILIQKVF